MSHFGLGLISSNGVPGNDAFTKILLHMDGSNGGTTFTDIAAGAANSHAWTPTNAVTSTGTKKFGTAALETTAGFITTSDDSDFTLGSNDFALDFWINLNGFSGSFNLLGQSDAAANISSQSIMMSLVGGVLRATFQTLSATQAITGATNINGTSTFKHVAVSKIGTTVRLFLDGVQDATGTLTNANMQDGTGAWSIGRIGAITSLPTTAFFDEFRLSVGTARGYSANFTPPSGPYI